MKLLRRLFVVIGVLLLLGSAALASLYWWTPPTRELLLASSFASYAVCGFLGALGLLMLAGRGALRRIGTLLALIGLAVQGWLIAPLFSGGGGGRSANLVVMTSNLLVGAGDPDRVVRLAADNKVDLLVLTEVTPAADEALDRVGLSELLPYRTGSPRSGGSGTVVFSRYPLVGQRDAGLSNGALDMTVEAEPSFRLLAVHTSPPVWEASWRADYARLLASARPTGPTLMLGDFNATRDHAAFRRLLDLGYRDAAEQANSGWQPTWPRGAGDVGLPAWVPPMVAIDHALVTERFRAVSTRAFDMPGSDHRALVVRLQRTR